MYVCLYIIYYLSLDRLSVYLTQRRLRYLLSITQYQRWPDNFFQIYMDQYSMSFSLPLTNHIGSDPKKPPDILFTSLPSRHCEAWRWSNIDMSEVQHQLWPRTRYWARSCYLLEYNNPCRYLTIASQYINIRFSISANPGSRSALTSQLSLKLRVKMQQHSQNECHNRSRSGFGYGWTVHSSQVDLWTVSVHDLRRPKLEFVWLHSKKIRDNENIPFF